EQSVPTVEFAEAAFGLDAGRMGVPLVVELAGHAVPVGPDRGAIDAHEATLQAPLPRLCPGLAARADDAAMITHKLVLALVAAGGLAASPQPGAWTRLPAAPISPEFNARTSVWTGKQ